jgi:hypothetical protein
MGGKSMPPTESDRNRRKILLIVVLCGVLVAGFFALQLLPQREDRQAEVVQPTAPQQTTPVAVPEKPVIDYEKIQEDETYESVMEQRKADYGLDEGVDFIAKPDEIIKIGETTVSMQEILEKIRLQKGELFEKDLGEPVDLEKLQQRRVDRIRELAAAEVRFVELEKELAKMPEDSPQRQPYVDEHMKLAREAKLFRQYAQTIAAIAEAEKQAAEGEAEARAAARDLLYNLRMEKRRLEEDLEIPRVPTGPAEAYGIYVVRSGDNIWTIHFRFLKDYFDHRNIELSPLADEPDTKGFSSGVGKILKFSENMVYIYNLREQRLDVDLNLLQPMSKIVVFNMAEVFNLLDPIDYTQVNRIQFDGDTLWIPAEQ